jgi:hypothetical protein
VTLFPPAFGPPTGAGTPPPASGAPPPPPPRLTGRRAATDGPGRAGSSARA